MKDEKVSVVWVLQTSIKLLQSIFPNFLLSSKVKPARLHQDRDFKISKIKVFLITFWEK